MRLSLFAVVVGLLAGWAGGGRVGALRSQRLRASWLPVVWALIHFAVARVDVLRDAFFLYLCSFAALFVFAVINTARLHGLLLVAAGALSDGVVTAVNHGMPYSIDAVHHAGLAQHTPARAFTATLQHHPLRATDRLPRLGRVIAFLPFREVLSVGTIAIALGIGAAVYGAMCRPFAPTAAHARTARRLRRDGVPPVADRAPRVTPPVVSEPRLLDLTGYEGEVLAFDRPSPQPDAREGVALVRLGAAAPHFEGTDDLWRARERVRQLRRVGVLPPDGPDDRIGELHDSDDEGGDDIAPSDAGRAPRERSAGLAAHPDAQAPFAPPPLPVPGAAMRASAIERAAPPEGPIVIVLPDDTPSGASIGSGIASIGSRIGGIDIGDGSA